MKQQKPTVPELLAKLCDYYAISGNSVGGSLHIITEDGNVGDSHVRFCINQAEQKGDAIGADIGRLLLQMSKTQRMKLYHTSMHTSTP